MHDRPVSALSEIQHPLLPERQRVFTQLPFQMALGRDQRVPHGDGHVLDQRFAIIRSADAAAAYDERFGRSTLARSMLSRSYLLLERAARAPAAIGTASAITARH